MKTNDQLRANAVRPTASSTTPEHHVLRPTRGPRRSAAPAARAPAPSPALIAAIKECVRPVGIA